MVEQFDEDDIVVIVVYVGFVGFVLLLMWGSDKGMIFVSFEVFEVGGLMVGGVGFQFVYDVVKKNFIDNGNNCVVLVMDGDFNVGVLSDVEMVQLIEKKCRVGIDLFVFGFGRGNYQDFKMEKLVKYGNGNVVYIDSLFEVKKVFVIELGGMLVFIVWDVKIQVEFNLVVVKGYWFVGYEN